MKRLKHFLLGMENTTTYKEMYEGIMTIPGGTYGNPGAFTEVQYDPTYWYGDFAVTISATHKLAQDVPTLTWQIPAESIGVSPGDLYGVRSRSRCRLLFACLRSLC